jgi:hypothetical protein
MTYAQFKSLVQAYLHQEGNPKIADQVDNFVELGEATINRRVRTQAMLSTVLVSDLATGDPATYPAPSDFLEVYGIWEDGEPVEYLPVDRLRKVGHAVADGCQVDPHYTVLGEYFVFTEAPTASTTLTYYAKPAALAGISGKISTSLFPKYSDLYLYSALTEAAPLLRDEERAAYWSQQRERILAEIAVEDWDSAIPAAQPLRMRFPYGS